LAQVQPPSSESIVIRPIQTHDEYLALERLQRQVWNLEDVEIVPDHLLITAQKNGGVVLGAFDVTSGEGQMVGFVFGFVGLTASGKVKHCSHMAGVAPAYQSHNIGYRLKLAQREHVLGQGMDLLTWTFDPLESRNARLNFHKLGVVCRTYLRNLYGDMRDQLNVGLSSDRFQVEWHVASQHVADRLSGDRAGDTLSALVAQGIPILNHTLPDDDGLLRPPRNVLSIGGDGLLIQIPAHFQAIKLADLGLARAWREHTRVLFEAAFAAGYTAVDLLFDQGRSCYLLRTGWVE
jgi:predicted GNAT superfamily acetyltransferase